MATLAKYVTSPFHGSPLPYGDGGTPVPPDHGASRVRVPARACLKEVGQSCPTRRGLVFGGALACWHEDCRYVAGVGGPGTAHVPMGRLLDLRARCRGHYCPRSYGVDKGKRPFLCP